MINSDSKKVKSKIQKIDKEIDYLLDHKTKELQEPRYAFVTFKNS